MTRFSIHTEGGEENSKQCYTKAMYIGVSFQFFLGYLNNDSFVDGIIIDARY